MLSRRRPRILLESLFAAWLLVAPFARLQAQEHWVFLDNGKIRLGVNMDAGGSIGWFSPTRAPGNLLNAFDHGRYVQQSYYGNKDGSDWNGKPWRYNPVQGGSWKGASATVLEANESKNSLYVKTQPRQWASGLDVTDLLMEQWLTLDGNLARLKFRMTYTGSAAHQATHQELPAMFVMPDYETLVFCEKGQAPWTNAPLSHKEPGFPNEGVKFSEPWCAWVNAAGQAVGLYFPYTDFATTYRVRNSGIGNCSYIAPIKSFALTPGLVFEYETMLATGTVDQIRATFRKLQKPVALQEKPSPNP
jgi:hypothetical protein